MQLLSAVMAVTGLVAFVSAFAAESTLELPYPLQEVSYNGTIHGHQVKLNGTVQDMFAQMKSLYSDFDPKNVSVNPTNSDLTPRAAANKNGLICCDKMAQGWGYASVGAIEDGRRYLYGLGAISINARSCGRISCSYNSGIYLCNDNDYTIAPNAGYLTSYVRDITDACSQFPWFSSPVACGQEFDSDHYNVIVHSDSC